MPPFVRTSQITLVAVAVLVCIQAKHFPNGDTGNPLLARNSRSTQCLWKYETITFGHSACLAPSDRVLERGVAPEDQSAIVAIHNQERREVTPAATNMMMMSWDDEIANTAQRWAENCLINHDENYKRYAYGRFSVGQNLAWGSYKMTWTEAIKLWSDEKKDFVYGQESAGVVGHYTQMVWAESAKIGCGYANCEGTHYYVCNYGPAGNSDLKTPFKSGTTCADCPDNCDKGLCSCPNLDVCLNGGAMDLKTCTCSCKSDLPFFLQPNCALNCTNIQDPGHCRHWGVSGCERFSNVPQECPSMCGWCPAAGTQFQEPTSGAAVTLTTALRNTILLAFVLLSVVSF